MPRSKQIGHCACSACWYALARSGAGLGVLPREPGPETTAATLLTMPLVRVDDDALCVRGRRRWSSWSRPIGSFTVTAHIRHRKHVPRVILCNLGHTISRRCAAGAGRARAAHVRRIQVTLKAKFRCPLGPRERGRVLESSVVRIPRPAAGLCTPAEPHNTSVVG